ncbi:MAG: NTP transferase domain-containing protein [Psychrobacter sp.]|nr:NTP transferase domain-containing protein [Psychrobacter sp.]
MQTQNQLNINLAGVVILAGGLSSRMGSPKALLTLPTNETLLEYHIRHAHCLAVPILIADNGQQFMSKLAADDCLANDMDLKSIQDYQPSDASSSSNISSHMDSQGTLSGNKGVGPLGAIAAAMQQLTLDSGLDSSSSIQSMSHQGLADSWLLVISCDSLVTAPALWQVLTSDKHPPAEAATVSCLSDKDHLYPLLGLYHLSVADELMAYLDQGERRVMRFIEPRLQKVALPTEWQHMTNLNTPEAFELACQTFVNERL